jgi:uncharacterized membrane protein
MRTLAAVTIALMIASPSRASDRTYFSDSAKYASVGAMNAAGTYVAALSSTNSGVVESALAHVAMIRLTMPHCEMGSVRSTVATIERNGVTQELRYKAWVVGMLLDNSEVFAGSAHTGYEDPDALFAALAASLAEYYSAR